MRVFEDKGSAVGRGSEKIRRNASALRALIQFFKQIAPYSFLVDVDGDWLETLFFAHFSEG